MGEWLSRDAVTEWLGITADRLYILSGRYKLMRTKTIGSGPQKYLRSDVEDLIERYKREEPGEDEIMTSAARSAVGISAAWWSQKAIQLGIKSRRVAPLRGEEIYVMRVGDADRVADSTGRKFCIDKAREIERPMLNRVRFHPVMPEPPTDEEIERIIAKREGRRETNVRRIKELNRVRKIPKRLLPALAKLIEDISAGKGIERRV